MGDTDFAQPVSGRAKEIEYVSAGDVESAVSSMIDAAVDAQHYEASMTSGYSRGTNVPELTDASDYDWIKAYFEPLYDREPNNASDMADAVGATKESLESGRTTVISQATSMVEKWAGEAQHDFKKYFLDPFPNAITNQKAVVDELRVALHIYEGVLRQARVDAKKIADETKKVLDSLNDCTADDWKVALGLIGVAAAVVGAIPTGGASLGIAGAMALVGAGASLTTTAIDAANIEGGSVSSVLNSCKDALEKAREQMTSEEQAIADALNDSNSGIDGVLSQTDPLDVATVLPHEPTGDGTPNLTDGNTPGEDGWHRN